MAIDAKVSFISQVKRALAETVTVAEMAAIMGKITEVTDGFEMRETANWEERGTDDLLESWLAALNVEGKSPGTIRQYTRSIKVFMNYVSIPTRKVNVYHVRGFLAHEKERGLQDSSLSTIRHTLNSYFGWLHREGLIDKNPMSNVAPIKAEEKEFIGYSEEELARLKDACWKKRDLAIICFLESTGCRIGEMVGLNRDQLDLKELECIVRGKGKKQRPAFLNKVAAMRMKEYLEEREDDNPALFVNRNGDRFGKNGIRNMLNEVAKKAGVEHVHPHRFRRTKATTLTDHGAPIHHVKEILGHSKVDTTMKYIVRNQKQIKASFYQYS